MPEVTYTASTSTFEREYSRSRAACSCTAATKSTIAVSGASSRTLLEIPPREDRDRHDEQHRDVDRTVRRREAEIARRNRAAVDDVESRLARMYAGMRTLRLADGPDEVHRRAVAREELGKYPDREPPRTKPW